MSDIKYEQLTKRLLQAPQSEHFNKEVIDNWINKTHSIDGDRISWHVERVFGFGGSEMGGLVDSWLGKRNFRNTALQIVSSKLLLNTPSRAEPAMLRGTIMEDFAQQRFEDKLDKLNKQWKRLEDIQRDVIETKSNPIHPWMRSSLDGLYEIDGDIVIVDFKCPSTEVMKEYKNFSTKIMDYLSVDNKTSYGDYFIPNTENRNSSDFDYHVPFRDYIYQLHHYLKDAECKNITVDKVMLAVLDYQEGAESIIFDIEKDDLISLDIISAGDHYWNNYVLKGLLPSPDIKDILEPQFIPENIQESAMLFSYYKQLASSSEKKADLFKMDIHQYVESLGSIKDKVLKIGLLETTSKVSFNDELVESRLLELGYQQKEIDALRTTGSFDTKKLNKYTEDLMTAHEDLLLAFDTKDLKLVNDSLKKLKSIYADLPLKKKGSFDHKKVEKILLSCKEDPNCYLQENLNSVVTRKNVPEKELQRDQVLDELDKIQETLSYRFNHEHQLDPINGFR